MEAKRKHNMAGWWQEDYHSDEYCIWKRSHVTEPVVLPTQIVDILEDVQEKKEEKTDTSISDDHEDNDSDTKISSVSDSDI